MKREKRREKAAKCSASFARASLNKFSFILPISMVSETTKIDSESRPKFLGSFPDYQTICKLVEMNIYMYFKTHTY